LGLGSGLGSVEQKQNKHQRLKSLWGGCKQIAMMSKYVNTFGSSTRSSISSSTSTNSANESGADSSQPSIKPLLSITKEHTTAIHVPEDGSAPIIKPYTLDEDEEEAAD